ncbi:MAG: S9 family peptidase [Planctomycetota bacterium]|jgi:dipeptidyl aminopeptidase/acylaminoacyl peptidase
MRSILILVLSVLLPAGATWAGETYRKPPEPVLEVLEAPGPPSSYVSPTGDTVVLADRDVYSTLEERAAPYLRLAGVRVDPRSNGPYGASYRKALTILRIEDGRERRVELPENPRLSAPRFSADGRHIAFTHTTAAGVELWVADVDSGRARRIPSIRVNPLLGDGFQWMPDHRQLLVKAIPAGRGEPPAAPLIPSGPNVQEGIGKTASSTYEARDTLKTPHDEELFDHYMASQLMLVPVNGGRAQAIGEPTILASVDVAPDGEHLLVHEVHRPYSYLHAYWRFPQDVAVWELSGETVHVVAELPLQDEVPIHGRPTGPRSVEWLSAQPATLFWAEALDGGDPMREVPHRDRLLKLAAPFDAQPQELMKTEHRFAGVMWGESGRRALVRERQRTRRWFRIWDVGLETSSEPPRLVVDLSLNDYYNHPGWPVHRVLPNGHSAFIEDGTRIYLSGYGASPEGARPFLDRLDLVSLETERLFRCGRIGQERFVDFIDVGAGRFLTTRESPTEVPNFFVRSLGSRVEAPKGEAWYASSITPLTHFEDPAPQLRRITKRIVTYEREDGTPLSFTLYLPPDYEEGRRLPTVLWAYPLEYSDPGTAGQVTGTDKNFMYIRGVSPLFFLLEGYAVIANVGMPVIGPPDTAYDTFIEQLVSSAEAAIDEAVRLGVTDPDRVGVGGHSHGGLMTATLLAHSDLFRAGIARSGAYNHTMRPFGFQNERRTLWEAMDVYVRLSPVMHAEKLKEPILIMHGEDDQNPGTVPLQSRKLYESIRGTGGTARLVMLPHEGHGYRARESVEHAVWEQLDWFDRYVKNAEPRVDVPAE